MNEMFNALKFKYDDLNKVHEREIKTLRDQISELEKEKALGRLDTEQAKASQEEAKEEIKRIKGTFFSRS